MCEATSDVLRRFDASLFSFHSASRCTCRAIGPLAPPHPEGTSVGSVGKRLGLLRFFEELTPIRSIAEDSPGDGLPYGDFRRAARANCVERRAPPELWP
jgi:hypothetical protein